MFHVLILVFPLKQTVKHSQETLAFVLLMEMTAWKIIQGETRTVAPVAKEYLVSRVILDSLSKQIFVKFTHKSSALVLHMPMAKC